MPDLDELLDLVFQVLAFLSGVSTVLVVPALFPSVGIVRAGHFCGRRDQLGVECLVQNSSPLGR